MGNGRSSMAMDGEFKRVCGNGRFPSLDSNQIFPQPNLTHEPTLFPQSHLENLARCLNKPSSFR